MKFNSRRSRDTAQLIPTRNHDFQYEVLAQHENWLNRLAGTTRGAIDRGSFAVGLVGVSIGVGGAASKMEYGVGAPVPLLVVSGLIGAVALTYNQTFFAD